jgi:pyruvate dehydrogenase E2 component (dihydrolipoamide acetyltransferase)
MAEIIMPKMGDAMTEGKVIRWYKQPGDAVKRGEPVAEIETDKVNLDLEAESDGTLGKHAAGEGETVQVGGLLAHLLAEGESEPEPEDKPAEPEAADTEGETKEDGEKEKPSGEDEQEPSAEDEEETTGDDEQKPAGKKKSTAGEAEQKRRSTDRKESIKHTTGEYHEAIEQRGPRRDRASSDSGEKAPREKGEDGGRRRSSPLARRMAREMGVSLDELEGSGPGGRIVAADVKSAGATPAEGRKREAGAGEGAQSTAPPLAAGVPALETKIIPLSAMRRTIAKRLGESTGPIPHFYLTVDLDVTNLVSVRQQMIDMTGAKLSLNDFVIRASALALRHHPSVNASWGDDAITQHGEVHIGIAVATPEGLITPVIRNADRKSVAGIATEVRALADKAKNRRLKPDEYQGSTFTISNLGAWGIEDFTAIINPPNVAILAIGAAEARAVIDENRQIIVRDRMKVTMSCDHRVVDGATGAEFLKTFRQYIEQPLRLVM